MRPGLRRETLQVGDDGAAVAHKIAQRLGADAALSGRCWSIKNASGAVSGGSARSGGIRGEARGVGRYGAVGGNYYEKQRPMTEDFVGFIQRSGVFRHCG